MKAVLVGPRPVKQPELKKLIASVRGAQLIAVDGGLVTCHRAGLEADIAVGDWDSLRLPKLLKGVPHLTLPRDKDQSDTYSALLAAVSLGADHVEGFGLTGGRPDHHFAVIADAAQAVASGYLKHVHLLGDDGDFYLFSGELTLKVKRGALVSAFAMGSRARGVSFQGLRFPVNESVISVLEPSSRGLSNVATRADVSIRVQQGVLMVIVPRMRA